MVHMQNYCELLQLRYRTLLRIKDLESCITPIFVLIMNAIMTEPPCLQTLVRQFPVLIFF